MAPPAIAKQLCAEYGIDEIADHLAAGLGLRAIAALIGCSPMALSVWIAADPVRSARADQARIVAAEGYEELAQAELDGVRDDAIEHPQVASALVALAKERAQSAWRRASVRDPRRYNAQRTQGDTYVDARTQTTRNITIVSVAGQAPGQRSEQPLGRVEQVPAGVGGGLMGWGWVWMSWRYYLPAAG